MELHRLWGMKIHLGLGIDPIRNRFLKQLDPSFLMTQYIQLGICSTPLLRLRGLGTCGGCRWIDILFGGRFCFVFFWMLMFQVMFHCVGCLLPGNISTAGYLKYERLRQKSLIWRSLLFYKSKNCKQILPA